MDFDYISRRTTISIRFIEYHSEFVLPIEICLSVITIQFRNFLFVYSIRHQLSRPSASWTIATVYSFIVLFFPGHGFSSYLSFPQSFVRKRFCFIHSFLLLYMHLSSQLLPVVFCCSQLNPFRHDCSQYFPTMQASALSN